MDSAQFRNLIARWLAATSTTTGGTQSYNDTDTSIDYHNGTGLNSSWLTPSGQASQSSAQSTNTGSGSGGGGGNTDNGQDTYEFVAFVLWYLFLVLCCVVPTCCAYRRRRLVEARLAQQQFELHRQLQLQQQNMMQQHQSQTPNFFILDQLSAARHNSERICRLRTEKLSEQLKDTTLTLCESSFEPAESTWEEPLAPDVEQGQLATAIAANNNDTVPTQPKTSPNDDDLFGDESTAKVCLPVNAVNANRSVPGVCAICLCPYEAQDKLSWSPLAACQHAFHTDCIVPWLAKKEEQKCPVCRQDYCNPIRLEDADLESGTGGGPLMLQEDIFLDSFALALNYARSQAARSWYMHNDYRSHPNTMFSNGNNNNSTAGASSRDGTTTTAGPNSTATEQQAMSAATTLHRSNMTTSTAQIEMIPTIRQDETSSVEPSRITTTSTTPPASLVSSTVSSPVQQPVDSNAAVVVVVDDVPPSQPSASEPPEQQPPSTT